MVDMNRIHFWHYVLNEEGQPIQNAEIRLYLNDAPTTEAIIYITETAISSTTCKNADIKTDKDGFFEFWLAGESGSGGYPHTQKFILEWFKAGTRPGYIYNLNPWPNALVWRDTNIGVGKDNLNKFISDYLANKWWTHTELIVPTAAPHNLQPVDFESGCDDDVYNKIVSNKFLNDILNGCLAGDTFDLSTIYDDVQEHIETVTLAGSGSNWTPSGSIYYINISHPTVNNVSSVRMVDINTFEEVIPENIIHLTVTSTRVFIAISGSDVKITIQGYSSSSSSSSSSSTSSSSSSSSTSSSSTSSSSSSSSTSSSSISSSSSSSSLSSSSSSSSLSSSSSSSSSSKSSSSSSSSLSSSSSSTPP